jgi:hypothetical protein
MPNAGVPGISHSLCKVLRGDFPNKGIASCPPACHSRACLLLTHAAAFRVAGRRPGRTPLDMNLPTTCTFTCTLAPFVAPFWTFEELRLQRFVLSIDRMKLFIRVSG